MPTTLTGFLSLDAAVMIGRAIASWSMAYRSANSEASAKFSDIMQISEFDPTQLKGDQILDLLINICLKASNPHRALPNSSTRRPIYERTIVAEPWAH